MSRTLKKVLVFFTFLCIIVVIVFCAELLLLNKEGGDGAGASSPPPGNPGAAVTDPYTPPPADSPAAADNGDPEDSETAPPEDTDAPQQDQDDGLYTLAMTETAALTVRVDEEKFEYVDVNMGTNVGYMFRYKGGGLATLEALLDYLPLGAAQRAVGLLDSYTGGAESIIEYDSPVGKSQLTGVFVTAMNGESTFAAWICDLPDEEDSLGVLLIIRYRDEMQKSALYEILNTVELISAVTDEEPV